MARVYGAGGAGGGEPRTCRRVRHPLELLRVHDLAGVGALRASSPGPCSANPACLVATSL